MGAGFKKFYVLGWRSIAALPVMAGCAAAVDPVLPDAGDGPSGGIFQYSDYVLEQSAQHVTWDSVGFTAPMALPVGGGASFDGVMGLRLQVGSSQLLVKGSLALNVSFANNSLAGGVQGFMDENENALGGTLGITGGVLDRAADLTTQFTYSANIDGTLVGVSDTYAINGDLQGDFKGPSASAVVGIVAGTIIAGSGGGFVFGDFIAAQ